VIPTSTKTISTKNVASNKQKNPVNGKPSKADTKNTDTQNKHFTTAEGHSPNLQELYKAIESVQNKIKSLWNEYKFSDKQFLRKRTFIVLYQIMQYFKPRLLS